MGEDYLVTSGQNGDDLRRIEWEEGSFAAETKRTPMRCYRMTPQGVAKLWEKTAIAYTHYSTPSIRDGHIYIKARGKVSFDGKMEDTSSSRSSIVCIELATGKIAAIVNEVSGDWCESSVGGDGFVNLGWWGRWEYGMFQADPKDLRVLSALQLPRKPHYAGWCTTPAYADGRLFLRTWDRMACYDLRMDERIAKAADAMARGESAAAVKLFVEAGRDPEATVRREAVVGLGAMGEKAVEAFDGLVGMVRDDVASSVRTAAVEAMGLVSRGQPGRLIELAAKGDHPNVRMGAVTALGGFDAANGKVVEAVVRGLDDSEPPVRLAALRALGGWKSAASPAASRLALMIRDEDGAPADGACDAMKAIGKAGADAIPVLVEAFRRPAVKRQDRAATALTAIGAASVGKIAGIIEDKDSGIALRAIGLLGDLGAAAGDAAPALRAALKGKDWPRAAAAASALVSIAEEQERTVSDAMCEALSDSRTNVVADAAALLARIAGGSKNEKTRQQIVGALAKSLSDRLGGGDVLSGRFAGSEFKRVLLQALGRIGPQAKLALAVVEKTISDADVSKDAADAWQKIAPGQPLPKPKMEAGMDADL